MQRYIIPFLALELTQAQVYSLFFFSHSLDCISCAIKKCAIPLSEPLDDHRPRLEWFRRSWCIRGPRGYCYTTVFDLVDEESVSDFSFDFNPSGWGKLDVDRNIFSFFASLGFFSCMNTFVHDETHLLSQLSPTYILAAVCFSAAQIISCRLKEIK